MQYSVCHQTVFHFDSAPQSVVQRLHLTPLSHANQNVIEWDIKVDGGGIQLGSDDFHGNRIHLCEHDLSGPTMAVSCHGYVEVVDGNGIWGEHENAVPLMLYQRSTPLSKAGPRLGKIAAEMSVVKKKKEVGDVELLHALSKRILECIEYKKGETDVTTTAEKAMEIGAGVCQDHVHAFTSVARLLGYSARYVSGYMFMEDMLVQKASHAWAEVYVKGLGWLGFDISNAISPDDRYIKLATGFDYSDVVPLAVIRIGEGRETLMTSISLSRQ